MAPSDHKNDLRQLGLSVDEVLDNLRSEVWPAEAGESDFEIIAAVNLLRHLHTFLPEPLWTSPNDESNNLALKFAWKKLPLPQADRRRMIQEARRSFGYQSAQDNFNMGVLNYPTMIKTFWSRDSIFRWNDSKTYSRPKGSSSRWSINNDDKPLTCVAIDGKVPLSDLPRLKGLVFKDDSEKFSTFIQPELMRFTYTCDGNEDAARFPQLCSFNAQSVVKDSISSNGMPAFKQVRYRLVAAIKPRDKSTEKAVPMRLYDESGRPLKPTANANATKATDTRKIGDERTTYWLIYAKVHETEKPRNANAEMSLSPKKPLETWEDMKLVKEVLQSMGSAWSASEDQKYPAYSARGDRIRELEAALVEVRKQRDGYRQERDESRAARDKALRDIEGALKARDNAQKECKDALEKRNRDLEQWVRTHEERDAAIKQRAEALAALSNISSKKRANSPNTPNLNKEEVVKAHKERDAALKQRDDAFAQRDKAVDERESAKFEMHLANEKYQDSLRSDITNDGSQEELDTVLKEREDAIQEKDFAEKQWTDARKECSLLKQQLAEALKSHNHAPNARESTFWDDHICKREDCVNTRVELQEVLTHIDTITKQRDDARQDRDVSRFELDKTSKQRDDALHQCKAALKAQEDDFKSRDAMRDALNEAHKQRELILMNDRNNAHEDCDQLRAKLNIATKEGEDAQQALRSIKNDYQQYKAKTAQIFSNMVEMSMGTGVDETGEPGTRRETRDARLFEVKTEGDENKGKSNGL